MLVSAIGYMMNYILKNQYNFIDIFGISFITHFAIVYSWNYLWFCIPLTIINKLLKIKFRPKGFL